MQKISFNKLQDSMSIFLDFPEVEADINASIQEHVEHSILTETENGERPTIDVLADYLKDDPGQKKLKLIIGMAGGSEEKLKRIVASKFGHESLTKVQHNHDLRQWIASFLIDPSSEPSFIPEFIRRSFNLPDSWIDLLKDKEYMEAIARNMKTMSATYSARMGFHLEKLVSDRVEIHGFTWEKGPVAIVDNKEVDRAIPNISRPQILVMVSYSVTTSSSQTSKANEQSQMYSLIQARKRSRISHSVAQESPIDDCIFVNVVDGGGWKSRNRDLEFLWTNCDYCFTYNSLDQFEALVKDYLCH